jgi:outer membrane immunogenic protein
MIKKALLSGAAFIALTSYANAADIAPEPVMDWTGFYLGVNAGLAGGDFDYDLDYDFLRDYDPQFSANEDYSAYGRGDFSLDSSGLLAGGQIGYNWQADQFVFGAEADFQWTGLEGDLDGNIELGSSLDTPFDPLGASVSAGSEVDWFGTLRLRAGWLITDQFLAYATGGAAYGKVKSSYSVSAYAGDLGGISFSDSTSETDWGWTLGAGAEYRINEAWSFKAEYLYVDLGSQTLLNESSLLSGVIGSDCTVVDCYSDSDRLKISSDTAFHTVRVGVNYKFW